MHRFKPDNKWLGIVFAMQCLILFTLWGAGPSISQVRGDGIPDAGAQREQLIQQSKATNEKLDKLLALLTGGDLRVTVRTPDEAGKH